MKPALQQLSDILTGTSLVGYIEIAEKRLPIYEEFLKAIKKGGTPEEYDEVAKLVMMWGDVMKAAPTNLGVPGAALLQIELALANRELLIDMMQAVMEQVDERSGVKPKENEDGVSSPESETG